MAALFDAGLAPAGLDARALAGLQVAAIGPGTAAALAARGVRADLVPDRFVAEALVDAFPAPTRDASRVLIARAEQARDVLPDGLTGGATPSSCSPSTGPGRRSPTPTCSPWSEPATSTRSRSRRRRP